MPEPMPQPQAPTPRSSAPTPRPSAGFTWAGFFWIWAGLIGAGVVYFGGILLNAVVVELGGGDPTPGEVSAQEDDLVTALTGLAVLSVLAGFVGAAVAARRHNQRRGEYGGRPRPTVRIFLSPRGLSRLLFTPRGVYGNEDPLISRLSMARSLAGVAVFASVTAYYRPLAVVAYAEQTFIQASNAIVVAASILVLTLVATLVWVEPAQRRTAARALCRPLLPLLYAGAVVGALIAFSLVDTQGAADSNGDEREGLLALIFFNVWALWPLAFVFCGTYYLARNLFNSADAHPMLPPLLSIVVTTVLAGMSLLTAVGVPVRLPVSERELPIPGGLATLLSTAGTLTTTALAVWEITRLRACGLRLRTGPWR